MIALHFRDNPADLLRRTSILNSGSLEHFGGKPLQSAGNPFHVADVLMHTAPLSIHSFQLTLEVYHSDGQMSTKF